MATVALLGADGAGKTTIVRRLEKDPELRVKTIYMGINPEALTHALPTTRLWLALRQLFGKTPVQGGPPGSTPKKVPKSFWKRQAARAKSNLRLLNQCAEEWYRQSVAWYYQKCGHVVVFDRHFYADYYSHHIRPNGSLPLSSRVHGWMLDRLYPKPDLTIFLDAPAEVLYERKREGSIPLLEKRREEYFEAVDSMKRSVVLDATRPRDEVFREVTRLIEETREEDNLRRGLSVASSANTVSSEMAESGADRRRCVLVTDAGRGSSLAIIRSLGRAGWRVVAADADSRSPGFCSRYVEESFVYPDPGTQSRQFRDTVHEAIEAHAVDWLIPVSDVVIEALLWERERFEAQCCLALEETAKLQQVRDKSTTLELAERLGVPAPESRVVGSSKEALAALEGDDALSWPIVIKPAVSARSHSDGEGVESYKVSYANSVRELRDAMDDLENGPRVILQEYCSGVGEGVEMLALRGKPIAAFQHRRLAEIPVSGGASARRESVPLDPELYDHARRLVEELEWTGLIMVEFRVGERARLMEINGRIWGSLPLAFRAGMDFPAWLADIQFASSPDARGEPRTSYPAGIRVSNLELSILWIVQVLLGLRRYPYLPAPGRLEALKGIWDILHPRHGFDIRSCDDPEPARSELRKIARKLKRKWRDRSGGSASPRAPFKKRVLRRFKPRIVKTLNTPALGHAMQLVENLRGRPNTLRVLTYHRVLDGHAFEDHARFLAQHYHVLSADELLVSLRERTPVPQRSVVITFDDAYTDFETKAWPALREHGLPVLLFVPTAFPDQPERVFWWERLEHAICNTARVEPVSSPVGPLALATPGQREQSFRRLKAHVKTLRHVETWGVTDEICKELQMKDPPSEVLGWDALRWLQKEGVTLGAHSQTHPFMDRLAREEMEAEVRGSLRDLEHETGEAPPYFAYPDGAYNQTVVEVLKESGVEIAFTTRSGVNEMAVVDPFLLRRIHVGPRDGLGVLRARLLGSTLPRAPSVASL